MEPTNIPFPWTNKPALKAAETGSGVLVPDEYWMTSLSFNLNYSTQLEQFLEQDAPLNLETKPWFGEPKQLSPRYAIYILDN